MTKKALITGITGQDGAYLAEYLLKKGYEVHGMKRRSSLFNTDRIDHLYQDPHAENLNLILHYGDLTDSMNITRLIQEVQPDEIYNLAAMSHVHVSFQTPEYVGNADGLGTLRILEAVRLEEKHFIISRIWRGDTLIIPSSQTVLHEGDHLLVLVHPEDVEEMEQFFGRRAESRDWNRPDIDWDAIDSQLVSKRIIITNSKVNGAKLGALRLRNQYGINITRIDRAGIEILATPDLHLQLGDRLSVVGEAQEIERASKFLGDSINVLDKPKLFSFFFGLAVGCILGSIPLAIPGLSMPIKLGLAGGPIIVGILMGAFGARLRIATYMSNSATQLIKQLGIILYLAGLGLASGEHFFEMIIHGDGLLWIGLGFLITYLPTMAVGLLSLFGYKKTHAETVGMLCGVMANSMALDYAMSINESRSSSVAYAIVYPVGMFVRIISAQILLSFFL